MSEPFLWPHLQFLLLFVHEYTPSLWIDFATVKAGNVSRTGFYKQIIIMLSKLVKPFTHALLELLFSGQSTCTPLHTHMHAWNSVFQPVQLSLLTLTQSEYVETFQVPARSSLTWQRLSSTAASTHDNHMQSYKTYAMMLKDNLKTRELLNNTGKLNNASARHQRSRL